jgi:threonine/homoserine/homoserine lactone efflux protein
MHGLDATQVAHIAGTLLVYSLAVIIPGPSFVVITKKAVSQGATAGSLRCGWDEPLF